VIYHFKCSFAKYLGNGYDDDWVTEENMNKDHEIYQAYSDEYFGRKYLKGAIPGYAKDIPKGWAFSTAPEWPLVDSTVNTPLSRKAAKVEISNILYAATRRNQQPKQKRSRTSG
jgi:hypothetical protein